jgi:hypothetical protein
MKIPIVLTVKRIKVSYFILYYIFIKKCLINHIITLNIGF